MNMKTVAWLSVTVMTLLEIACPTAKGQLPANFPGIQVTTYYSNKVSPGYIFLASWSQTPGSGTYLMILDNDGTPVDGDKYKELLETAGDFNLDGLVDFQDLAVLTDEWLKQQPNLNSDLDANGKVDFNDFAVFGENWNGTGP